MLDLVVRMLIVVLVSLVVMPVALYTGCGDMLWFIVIAIFVVVRYRIIGD